MVFITPRKSWHFLEYNISQNLPMTGSGWFWFIKYVPENSHIYSWKASVLVETLKTLLRIYGPSTVFNDSISQKLYCWGNLEISNEHHQNSKESQQSSKQNTLVRGNRIRSNNDTYELLIPDLSHDVNSFGEPLILFYMTKSGTFRFSLEIYVSKISHIYSC